MPERNDTTSLNGLDTHTSLEEVRSDEVQEIMGKMPPWIIRSGITLIGILFLCAVAGAWFFRYPEVIPATVVITPQQVQADIAAAEAWKAQAGQKVLIKLTAYPYEEFGMLQGTVNAPATAATDTSFRVTITLDHALLSTTGKEIPRQPRLLGTAEIMTADKSVLQRLLGRVLISGR